MPYQSFEDLVWQRSRRLAVGIFRSFENCKFVNLKNPIGRAALSVASNSAEGADRGGEKEFGQFLKTAKGSSGERRTRLCIARKLHALESTTPKALVQEAREISAMIEASANP